MANIEGVVVVTEFLSLRLDRDSRAGLDSASNRVADALVSLGAPALTELANHASERGATGPVAEVVAAIGLAHPDLSNRVGELLSTLIPDLGRKDLGAISSVLTTLTSGDFSFEGKEEALEAVVANHDLLQGASGALMMSAMAGATPGAGSLAALTGTQELVLGTDAGLLVPSLCDVVASRSDQEQISTVLMLALGLEEPYCVEVFRAALSAAERDDELAQAVIGVLMMAGQSKPELTAQLEQEIERASRSVPQLKMMMDMMKRAQGSGR